MAATWAMTALVSAPLHGRLAMAFDPELHRRLVTTNWIRTGAWTARALVVGVLAVAAIS